MGGVRDERKDVQALFAACEGATQAFNEKGRELYEFARMVACHAHCAFRRCLERKQSVRWWHAALVLFVAFSVFPSVSYAANEQFATVDGPFVTGQTTNNDGYVVLNASNEYISALAVIGRASDYLQLSNDQLARLSNSSTGGKFYELASDFVALGNDGSANHYVGWWGDVLYQSNEVYINGGYGHVWAVETNRSKIASALEDYLVIYNGGSLGGSGGSNVTGEPITIHMHENWYGNGFGKIFSNPVMYDLPWRGSPHVPEQFDLTLNEQASGLAWQYLSNGYDMFVCYEASRANYVYINLIPHGKWHINYGVDTSHNDKRYLKNVTYDSDTSVRYWLRTSSSQQVYCVMNINQNGDLYIYQDNVTWNLLENTQATSFTQCTAYGIVYAGGENEFGTNTPVVPPTNWPDNPTVGTPEPPEVPSPVNDTPSPQPDPPTFQVNPMFPVYVDVSTTTYTVDLQGILDAMNDHCIHLQDALHWNFDHFWTVLSTKWTNDLSTFKTFLDGQFGWIGDTIVEQMQETRDYLKELFDWLADQFDFSFSGDTYNDKNVVSWLRKIYSKLGTGGNTKPVDPVSNPTETGSWLDTLINNLLTALGDLFPGLLDQVREFFGGALGNLTSKFPFSIPWDVAAILGLLAANPVAPSVTIPAYTVDAHGLTQAGSYEIDLDDYDAAFGAVRLMMRIAFALYVCVHTKDFLDVIERVMM